MPEELPPFPIERVFYDLITFAHYDAEQAKKVREEIEAKARGEVPGEVKPKLGGSITPKVKRPKRRSFSRRR